MVSAVIQEDRYEVSVTVSFVSSAREEPQVGPATDGADPAGRTETLSSVTERSADSSALTVRPVCGGGTAAGRQRTTWR
ncbi:hypothetical protein PFLUV_G00000700 [Perca fluviatilis]|uniref:Uncharacterized protein n=1 Tax=Perca fluviatilis TaxID=8168 RepID=A0A6A5FG07_PERFL|nr:hypothetical protein PFLUV_G00000700 [Perca fluviatilis]